MQKLIRFAIVCALFGAWPAFAQQPVQGSATNRTTQNPSATIATGNTFQTIVNSGAKQAFTIQNNNTNGDNCWVDYGVRANGTAITAGNATKGESILLGPGGSVQRYWPYVPSDEIEATCVTSSDTLHVEVQ